MRRGCFAGRGHRRHLGMPAARDRIPQQAPHSLRRRNGRRAVAGHDRGRRVRARNLRALRNRRRPGRLGEGQAGARSGIHAPPRRHPEALEYPACTKLLGPLVPGTAVAKGARVPGTRFELDPVQAAFNIGAMIRWLDFNDTWLAAEWGHPSDNLGGILAVADWLSRNGAPLVMRDVLTAMIKAHEIQRAIALQNGFNRVGLDHVVLVKVASTAVVSNLLGLSREAIINAVSHAWVDGQALRTYRHAPNTGSRKSWAAGDATSRAVRLALIAKTGEMGYPSVLTAKTWGFYDVLFRGKPFRFPRQIGRAHV